MPVFSRQPKSVKALELQALTSRTLFGLYNTLPPEKQRLAMKNDPAALAARVQEAVVAGFHEEARAVLDKAAKDVPRGVTAEQWTEVLQPAFAALR